MLRQLQIAHDVWPQQADDIGEDAIFESREDLLCHAGPPHQVTFFQHQYLFARFGQVGGGDQPVVPTADDDRVNLILGHGTPYARFLGGSKKGVLTTVAAACLRPYSTVTSTSR